jgi:hypothetical protein
MPPVVQCTSATSLKSEETGHATQTLATINIKEKYTTHTPHPITMGTVLKDEKEMARLKLALQG